MNKLKMSLNKLIATAMAFVLVFTSTVPVIARPLDSASNRFSRYSNDPVITVGEGISVATGDFTRRYIDIELTGFNPLRFIRTYNSANVNDSAMGIGWRHNFMVLATENAATGAITITMGDGVEITFVRNADGSFSAPANVDYTLIGLGGLMMLSDELDEYDDYYYYYYGDSNYGYGDSDYDYEADEDYEDEYSDEEPEDDYYIDDNENNNDDNEDNNNIDEDNSDETGNDELNDEEPTDEDEQNIGDEQEDDTYTGEYTDNEESEYTNEPSENEEQEQEEHQDEQTSTTEETDTQEPNEDEVVDEYTPSQESQSDEQEQ